MAKSAPKKNLSTEKRTRQAEKRNIRNRAEKSKLKTISKQVIEVLSSDDKDKAAAAVSLATKVYNSAVSKGVLHKNTAARNISRLAKKANQSAKPAVA